MLVWYNDNEPYVRRWLQALRAAGHIPRGFIDDRSIQEIQAKDLEGYGQCHFFAGIAGWPFALRLAGWPEDREVWTGSCPCQPFSIAGQGGGIADERHVWPEWLRLIEERRPATIFGEQVASPLGREWLAGVHANLEALGYAVGAADLCAASAGSPQIRQRLWWVACAGDGGRDARLGEDDARQPDASWRGFNGGLGDASGAGLQERGSDGQVQRKALGTQPGQTVECPGNANFWSDFDLIPCTDGKSRRVESGTFPLAHGVPNRVGRLRAYGNAIVPQVAAEFVKAFMETET